MRSFCLVLFLSSYFFLLLCFPSYAASGAAKGLSLWFQSVIPVLFPFSVITSLMIRTNALSSLLRRTGSVFSKFFHVSRYGTFAILTGFLCGYPMGAKVIADMRKKKWISPSEASYLLSFCNNLSPMFIIGYIALENFHKKELVLPSVLILIVSPLLCSFFFRIYHQPKPCLAGLSDSRIHFRFSDLDQAVTDSFVVHTKVGGYMILFSVALEMLSHIPVSAPILNNAVFPSLEIAGGIRYISSRLQDIRQSYVPIMALSSFGGFCCIAQTKAMLEHTDIPLIPYIIEKLITAMVTSFLSYCYISVMIR